MVALSLMKKKKQLFEPKQTVDVRDSPAQKLPPKSPSNPSQSPPNQTTDTKITFPSSRGGTTEVSIGNERFPMTPEEYLAYQNKQGGLVTQNVTNAQTAQVKARLANAGDVQALKRISQQSELKKYINDQLRNGKTITEVANNIESGNLLTPEEIQNLTPPASQPIKQNGFQESLNTFANPNSDFGQTYGAALSGIVSAPEAIPGAQQYVTGSKQNAAQIIDFFTSALSSRKGVDVIKAEATFNDASNVIDRDIELVKTDWKSVSSALGDIEQAESAINRLKETTKGLSKENLRYWADNGAEIDAQIRREERQLQTQKAQLIAEYQRSRFGLNG
jgi:hypothetical protein